MRFTISILLALSASKALAQELSTPTNGVLAQDRTSSYNNHTVCYNFFQDKDGCVWSSAGSNRCRPKQTSEAQTFELPTELANKLLSAQNKQLKRRYNSYPGTGGFVLASGTGACNKYYDTNSQDGVCLWTGPSRSGGDPKTAGWLNGADNRNCGKQVYITRPGMSPIYVPIVDGCSFNQFSLEDRKTACFGIAFTKKTFNRLRPSADEIRRQRLTSVTWDFDNEHGNHPENAPRN
ncbi:hypothetical protein O181_023435 [Austropuccinia psidii MF-1]|uniref:Secreted protein n=1 Tax=Austropuccinia psidii MF-1 TaxID=1389203 RepID=A0A9Q3CJ44_9BASI|nr:hypothetical protein [Austropuccinia psidii MF-1]